MLKQSSVFAILAIVALGACAVELRVTRQERLLGRFAQSRRSPQRNAAETTRLAGLDVSVWRPKNSHVPSPLVIFSHGFHGSSTQSTFLMRALADDGYLVIAPNHKDSMRENPRMSMADAGFGKPDGWTDATFSDRRDDVIRLVRSLKTDPQWSKSIDWTRLALAGHSLGGYTVLGLAGAWPSWKLPDIKAVVAMSPYCAPFVQRGTLSALKVPVLYEGGTRDVGITPTVKRRGGAFDLTPAPAEYVEFEGAGHFAWTDLNPKYQESIDYYSIAFLDKYVKGDRSTDRANRRSDVADMRSK